jgi:hypothetical protein
MKSPRLLSIGLSLIFLSIGLLPLSSVQTAQQQTVEAALTATVLPPVTEVPTITPDPVSVEQLTVTGQRQTKLIGGAGRTSAYLSPDGTRFAYLEAGSICIYTPEIEQQGCVSVEDIRALDTESVVWSPDSRYLVMTEDFLRTFNDSDLWLIDTGSYELTNLTDDQVERYSVEELSAPPGNIDLAPQWSEDSSRIYFIRYTERNGDISAPLLYSITPDGSGLEEHTALHKSGRFNVYAFDTTREKIVYNHYANSETEDGIWMSDRNGDNAKRLTALPTALVPYTLTFSPDERYILATAPQAISMQPGKENGVYVVEADIGDIINVDEPSVTFAGWAPMGSALIYQVLDPLNMERTGIYLTDQPGEPGVKILEDRFYPSTSRATHPFDWGANNLIMMTGVESHLVNFFQLGEA